MASQRTKAKDESQNKCISGMILDSSFEVSNELGPDFAKSAYQKALLVVLRKKCLAGDTEFPYVIVNWADAVEYRV